MQGFTHLPHRMYIIVLSINSICSELSFGVWEPQDKFVITPGCWYFFVDGDFTGIYLLFGKAIPNILGIPRHSWHFKSSWEQKSVEYPHTLKDRRNVLYHFQFYNYLSERKCNQLNRILSLNCNSRDLGCTTPQITVDYESIPMWWWHVSILLSKTPTLCWMWSGRTLIQVSYFFDSSVCPLKVTLGYLKKAKEIRMDIVVCVMYRHAF